MCTRLPSIYEGWNHVRMRIYRSISSVPYLLPYSVLAKFVLLLPIFMSVVPYIPWAPRLFEEVHKERGTRREVWKMCTCM